MTPKEELDATTNITAMICGLILACFVLTCLTYSCTRPSTVNAELQAQRIIENNQMVSCVRAGGSWMPVAPPGGGREMSCVTDKTLPLAAKMNLPR